MVRVSPAAFTETDSYRDGTDWFGRGAFDNGSFVSQSRTQKESKSPASFICISGVTSFDHGMRPREGSGPALCTLQGTAFFFCISRPSTQAPSTKDTSKQPPPKPARTSTPRLRSLRWTAMWLCMFTTGHYVQHKVSKSPRDNIWRTTPVVGDWRCM